MKAGHVIAGKYRLEELAGCGGMGLVWRARHTELGTTVAVKVLVAGAERDPGALRRFRREARAAAALRCPHVVDIRDFGLDGVFPYIVMEYLEGESMASRLSRLPGPKLSELASWVTQAAVALDYAHARGFLHRDVKPSNLFLCRVGSACTLKMLDFGIVKSLHEADAGENTVVGSPGYLSPEQARGEALDHTSDLWSLAAVIYRALTAVEPFAASSLAEVVERVCVRPVAPPTTLVPDLPPALDGFFERALRRERSERFRSGAELAEALAAIASSAPDLELPVTVANERAVAVSPRADSTQSWASFAAERPTVSAIPTSSTRRFIATLFAVAVTGLVLIASWPALSRLANGAPSPPLTVPGLPEAASLARVPPTGEPTTLAAEVTTTHRTTPPPARSPELPGRAETASVARPSNTASGRRRGATLARARQEPHAARKPHAAQDPHASEPEPAETRPVPANPPVDPTFGIPLGELGEAHEAARSENHSTLRDP